MGSLLHGAGDAGHGRCSCGRLLWQRLRRLRTGEQGDALTEMVIATPVLILFISIVMQFVLWGHATHVAQAAAAEGARAARVAGGSVADAKQKAGAFLHQAGADMVRYPVVDVALDARRTRVEVTGRAPQLVPFLRVSVRAVSEAPTERFRSAAE